MIEKAKILDELGEDGLLLPVRVAHALAANDQAKYYFALLQAARAQAESPAAEAATLRHERLAARIEDAELDAVVATARRLGPGRVQVPRGAEICARIRDAVATMAVVVPGDDGDAYRGRLEVLAAGLPKDDAITSAAVDAMTSGDRDAGDSLHLLVMDLHKAINRIQAEIAEEDLDGAKVYALSGRGRDLVRAFMAGLNRTAPLKFDHPGLGTTATEVAGAVPGVPRLLIQNDIGTTDAHVLVVTVEGRTATLTYTDIHLQRLAFFRGLFAAWDVDWSAAEQHRNAEMETGAYQLTTGTYIAGTNEALERYLAFLGSRLVFLIDWNKARKRLRNFVDNGAAQALLAWAADNEVGHRGFLELGGEQAVYEAIELCAAGRLRYGDRLDGLLGEDAARDFLRGVLKDAAEGLLAGRSPRLIKDEIKAELLKHFDSAHQGLLALAERHTGFVAEIAAVVEDIVARTQGDADATVLAAAAERCRAWEMRADELLNKARQDITRGGQPAVLLRLFERLDDAADGLEEGAFLLTLTAERRPATPLVASVAGLAALLVEASREMVKGLASARLVGRAGERQDAEDLFATVDRVLEIEHLADDGLRAVSATLIRDATDFRDLHLITRLAETLERASDALALAAQVLRSFILDEVLAQ